MSSVDEIIEFLQDLKEEHDMNKSISEHVDNVVSFLQDDAALGKDRALTEIEELMESCNLDPSLRSDIFSVVSMLETL